MKHEKYDYDEIWEEIWGPGGVELTETLADSMALSPGSNVLDGGAGSGETSCFLAAEYKWNVLSVEIDPQYVPAIQRKANERGLAGVVAIRGNLADLDLADESVDGVICQGVFEMLDEQRPKALREMKRILRPGGRIVIADPMQTREVPNDEALRLYGEDDSCRFRKLFRTLEWNVDLANRTDLEVISAYYHPDSKRFWDDFYAPLLDEEGQVKEEHMHRETEVEIWKKDAGRYHSIGVMVLRKPE